MTNADGSANTIVVSHKFLQPSWYSTMASANGDLLGWWNNQVTGTDEYDYRRLCGSANPIAGWQPGQDTNTPTANAGWTAANAYQHFGSAHPGAMPCCYADGSVRNFAYTATNSTTVAPAGTVAAVNTTWMVWYCLWAYNDGVTLSVQ